MVNLSVCMIVKNEENSLPNCLESVRNLADEIIVLDTGSLDKTPKIAEEFGAKVYHFNWCDDFAIARNEALKYVSGKWVLILDADEILNQTIIPILQKIMQRENNLVINLVREEIGAKQSPYSLLSRLFRKHPEIYFTNPYHAMIDDSVIKLLEKESHWVIASLPQVAIFHTGYEIDTIIAKDKVKRAKKAMEKYLSKNPNDAYTLSKLGALYVELGDENKGIYLLERGLKKTKDPLVLYELYYHLGIAYNRKNKIKTAKINYILAAFSDILPQLRIGAYNNLGSLYQSQGEWRQAQNIYEKLLEIHPHYAVAYYNLGITLKSLGEFREAIINYKKAIKLNPEYAEAYQNLGVVLFKVGKIEESLSAFKQAILLHEKTKPEEAKRLRQELQNLGISLESLD